jgi:membrane protease YdiL (CAAX protease family)
MGTVLFAGQVRGGGVRHDFGLALRPVDIPVGLAAGLAAQVLVSGAYAVVERLVGGFDADETAKAVSAKGTGAAVVVLFLLFAVVAPFVEELFFRGLLLRSMELHAPAGVALVLTSLIFAAIHFELILLPGLFVAGLVFGYLAQRTGRLGPAIFAHIGFNAATIIALAWTR